MMKGMFCVWTQTFTMVSYTLALDACINTAGNVGICTTQEFCTNSTQPPFCSGSCFEAVVSKSSLSSTVTLGTVLIKAVMLNT